MIFEMENICNKNEKICRILYSRKFAIHVFVLFEFCCTWLVIQSSAYFIEFNEL